MAAPVVPKIGHAESGTDHVAHLAVHEAATKSHAEAVTSYVVFVTSGTRSFDPYATTNLK